MPELCRFSLWRRFEKVNEEKIRTAESQKHSSLNLVLSQFEADKG